MKIKNREYLKDLLESQIKYDIEQGDTTVLAEIISQFSDNAIFNFLSDDNQEQAKHTEPKTNVEFYLATYKAIESDEANSYEEILAVFVDEVEAVVNGERYFSCYVHFGQHSTCSQSFIAENCRKIDNKEEYLELFNELTNKVGYNLNVL